MKRIVIIGAAVAAVVAAGAWGVTKFTTDQANIVAAPVAINLAGVSAANGTSRSFATADHIHSISGLLPAANVSKDATLVGTTTLGLDLTHANTWTGIQTLSATGSQGNPIMTPQTSAPSAPSNGAMWVDGTTTAMTPRIALNGVKQPFLTFGPTGSRAVQVLRGVTGCSTAASIGATCNTAITWPSAFPDANYGVWCTCIGAAGLPVIGAWNTKIAASVNCVTIAMTAAIAQCSTIDAFAIHD